MTPPETPLIGIPAYREFSSAAFLRLPLTVLTQRRDFQRAARGKRVAMPGFILQMQRQVDGESRDLRVGYTCSKKVGNAVARNRAKRRLREIARVVLPEMGKADRDYVLIGRNTVTASLPFDQLISDLQKAITILHGSRT